MDHILALAEQLGKLIAEHPRTKALEQAVAAVRNDPDARTVLRQHRQQLDKIRQLEAQIKPVEVADKRRLADLEAKMVSNQPIQALLKAQADYAELMHRVNQAIESRVIRPDLPRQDAAAT